MSVQNDTFPKSVKIPWQGNEEKRFEAFLARRCAKKGPFLRRLVLEKLNEDSETSETNRGRK